MVGHVALPVHVHTSSESKTG
jgi:hypothetical protein